MQVVKRHIKERGTFLRQEMLPVASSSQGLSLRQAAEEFRKQHNHSFSGRKRNLEQKSPDAPPGRLIGGCRI